MSKWLISAYSYTEGKADVRWFIEKDDIDDDKRVKEILSDKTLTKAEKEKQITERVEQMLEEQGYADAEIQNAAQSSKPHLDHDEIGAVLLAAIQRDKEELTNQLYDYLITLGTNEDVISRVTMEMLDTDKDWEQILKSNKIVTDPTITDILNRYSNITK
jgi:hypothetical protein